MSGFHLVPGLNDIPNQPTELFATSYPVAIGMGPLPSGPTRPWLRDKTRDTVVSGYYYYKPGLPPISCMTVWPMLQQLQPLLTLEGFPMDPGLFSRYFKRMVSDTCHANPVSQTRGSCQAPPADSHHASTTPSPGSSYQDPTMDSRPTSTLARTRVLR